MTEEVSKGYRTFLNRISLLGVLTGFGFIVVINTLAVLAIIMAFFSAMSSGDVDVYFFAVLTIATTAFVIMLSGILAAYLSKSREYIDGIINGLIACLLFEIFFLILEGFHTSIIMDIAFFFPSAAIGGVIGILIRRKFKKE